jgi:bifunctional NMN adenylyltransferase/nudix hydrolase
MPKFFKDNDTLGVIISRMQVPYLTASHINMIETVQQRHNKLLILLGVADVISTKNPLPFLFRKQMLEEYLRPTDIVMPLKDNNDNSKWVRLVDTLVNCNIYGSETATIYGGRDSFIPYYVKDGGSHKVVELLPEDADSGTDLRNLASITIPVYSVENAQTIIYTVNQILAK